MKHQRTAVTIALATVGIDAMGIGIVFPVMPDLLLSLGSRDVSEAAVWGGLLTTIYALMQFLCAPFLGALSDRHGRRPVLLWTLFALVVDYLIMSFAGALWLLLLGRALAGAAGATYGTATAYLADISAPAERARRFGLVGATFGLGFVLGPALGGLVGELHVRAPFVVAALLAAANLFMALACLPESLPGGRRRAFEWRRANPFGAIRRALSLPALRWLLAGYLLLSLGNHVYPVIWAFWTKYTFAWSVGAIGLSLAAYGLAAALVQSTLVQPCIWAMGEARTVVMGLMLGAFAALAFGVISHGALVFVILPLAAFSDVAMPALTGVMANRVGDDEQGELQGVLASLMALASVLVPPAASGLFYAFTGPGALIELPGAPFLLTAVLVGIAVPVMWRNLFARADARL